MFYALAEGRVDTEGLAFVHELSDIESLNRRAMAGELAVTAVSFHAYAHLADRYLLLPHGASFGDGYGPVVVARASRHPRAIASGARHRRLAGRVDDGGARAAALGAGRRDPAAALRSHPGGRARRRAPGGAADPRGPAHVPRRGPAPRSWTSAAGGRRRPGCRCRSAATSCAATSARSGSAASPAPSRARSSTAWRTAATALDHAMRYARGLDRDKADRFVGMYVNAWTQGYGEAGRRAVQTAPRPGPRGRPDAAGARPSTPPNAVKLDSRLDALVLTVHLAALSVALAPPVFFGAVVAPGGRSASFPTRDMAGRAPEPDPREALRAGRGELRASCS